GGPQTRAAQIHPACDARLSLPRRSDPGAGVRVPARALPDAAVLVRELRALFERHPAGRAQPLSARSGISPRPLTLPRLCARLRAMTLRVEPLPGVGAEICGVDLGSDISDAEFARMRAAYAEHGVIFFRDQDISEEQHVAFARRWGPINVNRFLSAHPA